MNDAEVDAAIARIDAGIQDVRETGAEIAELRAQRDAAAARLAQAKQMGKDARQAFLDACARRDGQ